jgi:hypothetical protein
MSLSTASSSAPTPDITRPSSRDSSSPKSERQREVYALQVQAFLDAADEVDIDEETAMDILQGFDGDLHIGEDDEVNVEVDGEPNTSTEINELDENWESEDDGASSEHDMHEEEGKNIAVLMAAKCICIHGVCGGHALCRI